MYKIIKVERIQNVIFITFNRDFLNKNVPTQNLLKICPALRARRFPKYFPRSGYSSGSHNYTEICPTCRHENSLNIEQK